MATDRTGSDHRAGSNGPLVRAAAAVEEAGQLDRASALLRPVASALVGERALRDALQGRWLGHALHPLMTDLPIGFWTSATVLDLVGGEAARPAARRLTGLGVLAAVPTALTGLAEFGGLQHTRDRRTATAHALGNVAALSCYTGSWIARRRGRWTTGVALALAGSAIASGSGFLGGHLSEARKVSSRNPAFAGD
jgi:uncharacterized membrane protein